jgi:hypothetical protein
MRRHGQQSQVRILRRLRRKRQPADRIAEWFGMAWRRRASVVGDVLRAGIKTCGAEAVAFVDDLIESTPLVARPDLLASWKQELSDIESGLRTDASKGASPT